MQQLAAKASVEQITDLGEFTAVAATYDVDRDNDRIVPGAFRRTIARWRRSGKKVPLHWNHSGRAADIIGVVDTMREIPGEGLYVSGRLDLRESVVAREAWRSMKAGALALSFGYRATKTRKRADGVQELVEIDLFEISVVPGPANPATRFLALKDGSPSTPTDVELRAMAKRLRVELPPSRRVLRRRSETVALDAALGWKPPPKLHPEPEPQPVSTAAVQRRRLAQIQMDSLMSGIDAEPVREAAPTEPTDAELREHAEALGIAVQPPRRGIDPGTVRATARAAVLALLNGTDA
jgi:Escherichia/Staphylococcus phage prohead protease